MAEPPSFQRAPRLRPELPSGEMTIPPPPPAPTAPSIGLLSVLLPGVLSVAALVAGVLTAGSNWLIALVSFGFMGVTSITSITSYWSQRRTFGRETRQREEHYRAVLDRCRQELIGLRDRQATALGVAHPAPAVCLARVEALDARLWGAWSG
jgi:S-DNA-T family DNA segregation ATPase FtsK/SpoIIIE